MALPKHAWRFFLNLFLFSFLTWSAESKAHYMTELFEPHLYLAKGTCNAHRLDNWEESSRVIIGFRNIQTVWKQDM